MTQIQWETRRLPIGNLKPYEHNPRKITKAAIQKLKTSIKEDGYHAPIIANADLTILAGHARWQALKELGHKEVDVRVPSRPLTQEEVDRVNLRDNVSIGGWDADVLGLRFDVDFLEDIGLPDNILNAVATAKHQTNEPEGDPDEVPEAPEEPSTLLGDVYRIGPHVLVCGDSTDPATIATCMQEGGGCHG